MASNLEAPFPWFGGKRRVAPEVWARLGDVPNYVEPFFGSGAVLLGRPTPARTETVNDLDGFICNFWRAVKLKPDEVAGHADNPVNENDLHARHSWLVSQREALQSRLEGDPEFCDPKVAGFWVWGICCWIAGGFCSGEGPWVVDVNRQLVRLGRGRGVKRQRVHLGPGQGVKRQRVHLGRGQGVNRQLVHLGEWMKRLSDRLANVRVSSGDWSRVCGPSPTTHNGLTGVFLDPPYSDLAGRDGDLYSIDSLSVAHDVREWAIANGDNPMMRIALCGYAGEHTMPDGWSEYAWRAHGGYSNQSEDNGNRVKERIWFSRHCLGTMRPDLFM